MSKLTLIRIPAKLPDFAGGLSSTFWADVGAIAQGNILDNIVKGRQGDGSALKANAPSTLARKRAKGRGNRSLVDARHRFVQGASQSWRSRVLSNGAAVVIEAASGELAKLVTYVRALGYRGWEKLSPEAYQAISAALQREIRRLVAHAKAKAGTQRTAG